MRIWKMYPVLLVCFFEELNVSFSVLGWVLQNLLKAICVWWCL